VNLNLKSPAIIPYLPYTAYTIYKPAVSKPIIDIQVGVRDFQRAFKCVEQFEQLGYTYKGENGELRQY